MKNMKLDEITNKEEIVNEIVSDINYDSVINDINNANTFIHSSSKKLLDSKKKFAKTSFELLSDIKKQSISSPKIIVGKKTSQSKENFTVEKDTQEQKLLILKSIDSKLIFKPNEPKEEKEKDSSDSLFKSIFSNIGSMGGGLAAGKFLKKIPLKKVGKLAGKGFGLVNAAISIKNLIGTVRTGFKDYKKLKAAGDNVGASNSLLKALVMGSGNIMNIVGGLIPGPIGWLLMGSGTLFESMAGEFDSIWADKNNKQIQDQQKVARIDDMISTGKNTKGEEILQLRNSLDFTHWEYKDYNTDKWVPLVDNKTGKPLSLSSGKNKVKPGKINEDGIQRYQLETGQSGLVDIVMKNGKPQMLVNDKPTQISTRANGGPVKKGGKYLIGENGPEAYVPNNDELRRILKTYNNSIIEANKKIVTDIQLSSREITKVNFPELDITIPKYTIDNMKRDVSFSSIPKMDGTYTRNTLPTLVAPTDTRNSIADLSKAKISDDVKKALLSLPANSRNYAIKIASIESSYNAKAKASSSSASGLFQFTKATWLDAIKLSKDPKHKKYTLEDRLDPVKSAELFPIFFKERERILKTAVANPSDTDYYLAHFLGPYGAKKFISAYHTNPNDLAANFVNKKQVAANPKIFYNNGDKKQPKTLQEIYVNFGNKLNSRYSQFGVDFIPVLDKGTERVKSSGPALLHEGEIVVPANKSNKIRSLSNTNVYSPMRNQNNIKDIEEEFIINTLVNAMAEAVKKEYDI